MSTCCDHGFIYHEDGTVAVCEKHKPSAPVAVPSVAFLSPLFTWRSALTESRLDAEAKLVALCLSLYMNEKGGGAFPSIDTLAKDASLDRKTIMRRIRTLASSGWLEVSRTGRGRAIRSTYTARIPRK